MFQDTLQRLRGGQQAQATNNAMTLIALETVQTKTLNDVLSALDLHAPRKFIGLFGPHGSGKTTLLNELSRDSVRGPRTPQHRKVVCAVVNATTLPSDIAAWQRLIFATLEKLGQQPGAPPTVNDLRAELEELIAHEQRKDETATLAGAAFAHHFRAAFAGIIHSCVSLSNATFVVAIDHIDKTNGANALQLLEASKYFLNAQNCTTLICADDETLLDQMGDEGVDALGQWMTSSIALPMRVATPSKPAAPEPTVKVAPKPISSDIPQACVQILTDALGSDRYAIERAGESWRGAMRSLARRNADGYDTKLTGVMMAKLCALKQLSPALFDAARFDAPLLINLERRARTPSISDTRDEWMETMTRDMRLAALFKAAPTFIGVEPRDLATSLRLVHGGDAEPAQPNVLTLEPSRPRMTLLGTTSAQTVKAAAEATALPRPRRESAAIALPAVPASIWIIVSVGAGTFILDRLVKLAIQAGAASFGTLVQPVPLNATNVLGSGLAIGAELIGLALCALIVAFWGANTRSVPRATAFGLIGGGLAANVFDRVAYGAVMNYLHIGNLPVFNLAHVGLMAGAVLLAYAILSNDAGERVSLGAEER